MEQNPWFGDSQGHRIAALMRWGKVRKGKVSRHRSRRRVKRVHGVRKAVRRVKAHAVKRAVKRHVRRRRISSSYLDKRTKAYRQYRMSQQREAASFLGLTGGRKPRYTFSGGMWRKRRKLNPFGRKSMARRKKRYARKRNTWFGQPRRHRKAAKKGWRRGHKIGRRVIRHRNAPTALSNPRRRKYRRSARRRNPAISLGGLTSQLTNVRGWAPLAVTGGLSAITGAIVPGLLPMGIASNPWAKLGVQLVVAIGGGKLVEKAVDARHGQAWMVVGVSMVGYQLLKQYVLAPYFPAFAVGLGEYPDYSYRDGVSQEVGAFVNGGVGAFVNDYPGVGADQELVGSYPFDGQYGY